MALGAVSSASDCGPPARVEGGEPDPKSLCAVHGDGSTLLTRGLGCLAILSAIPLILAFRWVNFTLDADLYGFAFSIFGYAPRHPQIIFASFGVAAALILAAAAVACAANTPGLCASLGSLLVLVMFWAYLRVAVGDAQLLVALARQSDWWLIIAGHPQPFARVEPGVWSQLAFDTLSDRLISGWYYLGLGWYFAVISGLLIAVWPVASGQVTRTWAGVVTMVVSIVLLTAGSLLKPALAQRSFVSAVNFEAAGDLLEAKEEYRNAVDLDPWYALNSRIYERMGALDAASGRIDTPEYKVYQAERIFARNQGTGSVWELDSAVLDYDSVAETSGTIAVAAKMRAGDMRVLYGMHLFQDGAFGSAVALWNAALIHEPDNWLAAYYLTLGYPAVNGYRDLAELCERFLVRCRDPLTTGVFYNSLGAAQIEIGEKDAGHRNFYTSYKDDYLNNRAAITSLIGP